MRTEQLASARRGVDLLLAHFQGSADGLDAASAASDVAAAGQCADPLVTVAAILVRMLRDATYGSVQDALALVRRHIGTQISIADLRHVEQFIADVVSSGQPRALPTDAAVVAVVAQSIGGGAATELAMIENRDVNAILIDLREKLHSRGDQVPLSDRDLANAESEQHAADPGMREARQAAVLAITHHWNDAANALHRTAERNSGFDDARDPVTALALLSVTCAALNGGIYQLAAQGNLFPAMSLLRQLVEAEFILWKFSRDVAYPSAWLHSTAEERESHWRPSAMYRDEDNDRRQQDYAQHCELGGHPTPVGTRIAAGVPSFIPMASMFCDQITHSTDAWRHFVTAVDLIDQAHRTDLSTSLSSLDAAFENTIREHSAVDQYRYAAAFFTASTD